MFSVGIFSWLCWVPLIQGLLWGYDQGITGAACLGHECFQPGLLTWVLAGLRSCLAVGQMFKSLAMPLELLQRAGHMQQQSQNTQNKKPQFS